MDLNGPGISLFQGNELQNFDNLARTEEEEEEDLEEQRRRDLELKSMLENAFDDVSFENDEESVCNGSPNHSNANHSAINNNSDGDLNTSRLKKNRHNALFADFEVNSSTGNHIENFLSPTKHSKNNLVERSDFDNDGENYSDQCRKIQNGNLHDVVDASGGGDAYQSLHYKHCFQRSPLNDVPSEISNSNSNGTKKTQSIKEANDSSEQLKILYDVRVREVHRLTEMIDAMRNEHEMGMKKVKHQFALSQAEIERSKISQSQLQSLLANNKQELEKLEHHTIDLEKENKNLELHKNELINQLETNKLIINNLERKVLALEKGNRINSDIVQYETNMKVLIEKHNLEMANMNSELEKMGKQNEELIKENAELKMKINQISHVNDENLAKKSEIINRLSKQIDETQKQCENLMKSSTVEDNFRLQMELKMLKEEKSLLTSKLETLEKENSRQDEELKQYESLSKISSFASFSESPDIDGKLGAELYKALNGQKAKRKEIKSLQAQVDEKNDKINSLLENENILKTEIAKLKKEINRRTDEIKNYEELISFKETENVELENYLKRVKEEAEIAQNDHRIKSAELQKEVDFLNGKITDLENRELSKTNLNEEYVRFHEEGLKTVREETENFFKLEILKKDLENENLKREVDEMKNLYVEVFTSKEALLKEIEREKNSPGRNGAGGVDLDEVKRLQKELEKSRLRIIDMDQTLKQQYEQEVEILNREINQLKIQLEKMRKEKDREMAERDKISVENSLLKSEIEQVTSEKNLLFLNFEKLQKEMADVCRNLQSVKEGTKEELNEIKGKYDSELRSLTEKYETVIKKLKMEIDLTLAKSVKNESKSISPKKSANVKSTETQCSPISAKCKISTRETATSPIAIFKTNVGRVENRGKKEPETNPDSDKISRREVVEVMEKLGSRHENEIRSLENMYRAELGKLDRKFQVELDRARDLIREEMERIHGAELKEMEEKHRVELENRVEQEKKEAIADLITEWACEVQSLKASYAEAQTEMERMKMKYKAAKSVALQYKTYFKSKTEHMKEEWKRIEDGYEKALKELEKNVHILVDVKEDEVKSKVESITKIYEQKIMKMKEKLSRCEERMKKSKKRGGFDLGSDEFKNWEPEKLDFPDGNLFSSPFTTSEKSKEKQFQLNCKKEKRCTN